MEQSSNVFGNLTFVALEQATVLPYLSHRFAQQGARVIRLEHPKMCDPNRMIGTPFAEGESKMCSYFMAFNAGKEALTLDLKNPKGQELFHKLIKELDVDVFATNQLPKNYGSLGVDYDTLKAIKPDIIWVGLTGFGPESNDAAYDPVLQARGGLMDLTGEPDGDPQVCGVYLPDMGTSNHAYGEIMRALYERAVTGQGQRIDISMLQSTVSWLPQPVTMATSFDTVMHRRGNSHEFFAPVSVFPTEDGWVYLAMGNDVQWLRLIAIPGFEDLTNPDWEKNAGRIRDLKEMNEKIAADTKKWKTADLMKTFAENGLAVAKVNDITEVVADGYIKPNLVTATDPATGFKLTMTCPPVTTPFLREKGMEMSFPPRLGEHNEGIWGGELKLSKEELEALKAEMVI